MSADLETTTKDLEKEAPKERDIFKTLNPNKIYIPVLIGVAVTVYFSVVEIDFPAFFTALKKANWAWFIVAVILLLARDLGYMYRIKMISNNQLTWTSSIYVILLWEFASAVTPSVVGGTAVAVFILNREGLSFGKSMAYVMMTAMLDNLFFIVFAPVSIWISNAFGYEVFPAISADLFSEFIQENGLKGGFYLSYGLTVIYALFFAYGLIINPRGFKWLLIRVTSLGFMRRFRKGAVRTGDEMLVASKELRGSGASLWIKAILITFFIWIARYLMLNSLIGAFSTVEVLEHVHIFSRQVVMWIVMLLSPTPGSSGTAEAVFCTFYAEYLGGEFCAAVGILWRLFYYYPYLFVGAIILPYWIRRMPKKKTAQKKQ